MFRVVVLMLSVSASLGIPPKDFIAMARRREADGLWIATVRNEETFLFAIDASRSCSGLAIVGYSRPETIARFCLGEDGLIESRQSRRVIMAENIMKAPTLVEMSQSIQSEPRRCLPSERGLLFETVELLCFCLGHKPAVLRQRQANAGGAASSAFLLGAPASLFVPHTRALLTWLMTHPEVWTGRSRNQWGDHRVADPPFEESIVLARSAETGTRLVQLDAQDASVPGQRDQHATARYIAEVGRILGYPPQSISDYIRHEMLADYPVAHVNDALSAARDALLARHGPQAPIVDFVLGRDLPLYQPLTGLDTILNSTLPVQDFINIPLSLDWLFFDHPPEVDKSSSSSQPPPKQTAKKPSDAGEGEL